MLAMSSLSVRVASVIEAYLGRDSAFHLWNVPMCQPQRMILGGIREIRDVGRHSLETAV